MLDANLITLKYFPLSLRSGQYVGCCIFVCYIRGFIIVIMVGCQVHIRKAMRPSACHYEFIYVCVLHSCRSGSHVRARETTNDRETERHSHSEICMLSAVIFHTLITLYACVFLSSQCKFVCMCFFINFPFIISTYSLCSVLWALVISEIDLISLNPFLNVIKPNREKKIYGQKYDEEDEACGSM